MENTLQIPLEKIDDYRWRIPKSFKNEMRVPGIIYSSSEMLKDIFKDRAIEQVVNVATLPGIVKASLAMPDIHWGYGFPIGGVAATDVEAGGVISPGGVGYDINCGVRLVRTNLDIEEVKPKLKDLVYALFNDVPAGVGSKGDINISEREERELLVQGSKWIIEKKGYGRKDDIDFTESNGAIEGADPSAVSSRAYERGKRQSGTLGSGNHFLEVQVVEEIYDEECAKVFGLDVNAITLMIHSGSRGLGYQICDEYAKSMIHLLSKYHISVPDKQLACVPVNSEEGKKYLGAMRCAANYAWANRQCLMHITRRVFERVFNKSERDLGMDLVYDVAHNIAKLEKYKIDGKEKLLCVHRKGATRAFGPGHNELPAKYKKIGQPVIIPGDMARNSYLLVGTKKAEEETFGSTCHGAGRLLSRGEAIRRLKGRRLQRELESKGIIVMSTGRETLSEEAPEAYKNINDVVGIVDAAGIAKKVCRMRPLGVIKG